MPYQIMDFFNRFPPLIHDSIMYVSAASNEQQGGSLRPTHKKSLQTPKTKSEGNQGIAKLPAEPRFFLFGGLVLPMLYKRIEPMICELSHKFIGSASVRLAL